MGITNLVVIPNRRDMRGKHETNVVCSRCGSHTSAFLKIYTTDVYVPEHLRTYLCKSCLLKGVELIDKELLKQSKTRI